MMFTAKGIYYYGNNWLIIKVQDQDLARYYRKLHAMSTYYTDVLTPPMHSHITVISKYCDKPKEYYNKKYDGQEVEFQYDINANGCETYVWMTVLCDHAQMLRDELGLGKPFYPFHLTIGNRKEKRFSVND